MFRRFLALMLCLGLLPVASLAEDRAPYEVFTFSGSLPEHLREPLSVLIPDESRVLSGAAIQHNGSHFGTAPDYLDAYTAMVLVNTQEGLHLYAAAQVEGLPWQVNDYTRFLRQPKNVSVSLYQTTAYRIPVFSVDYAAQGGSVSDLFVFRGNMLWCVYAHIDQAHSATIYNEMNALSVTDHLGRETFWCSTPFYLDYMTDISAFPTTRETCQALSQESVYGTPAASSIVYASGANLRKEPTGKAESLGIYANNTPMVFTGEQKQGSAWPWYQVQIGNTVGWMSSNYVGHQPDYAFGPIPLGRTVECCPLYAAAGDKQPIMELAPGTTFHILTEYKGMYHICIPQGEISLAVDTDGVYGYIPTQDILTGFSPSALDAQSAR